MLSTIFQESLKNNQKFRSYRSILRFSVRVRVVLPSSFVVSNELRSKNPIEIDHQSILMTSAKCPTLPLPPHPSPSSHLESYSSGWYKPSNNTFLPVLWESTLYPCISMYILPIVLPSFPIVLTRIICLPSKIFLSSRSSPLFS